MEDRELKAYIEERIVTVREVNMAQRQIILQDQFGTTLNASVHFLDPQVSIPQVGERWTAKRQGMDWILMRRMERGTEHTPVTSLKPGDYRIEAANDLYLTGQDVIIEALKSQTITLNSNTQISGDVTIDGGIIANEIVLPNSGTSLPSQAGHGTYFDLVVDASGTTWHFRYNSQSTSSYKWEFIGGSPLFSEILTFETRSTAGFGDFPTEIGPSVTLPRQGDYMIRFGARMGNTYNRRFCSCTKIRRCFYFSSRWG